MSSMNEELWKCSCGFEFKASNGLYEADPSDIGTIHKIAPYSCPQCGNVENLSFYCSFDTPQPGNEDICRTDSTVCKKCGTEMVQMKKLVFGFIHNKYLCPECKKKELKYINTLSEADS